MPKNNHKVFNGYVWLQHWITMANVYALVSQLLPFNTVFDVTQVHMKFAQPKRKYDLFAVGRVLVKIASYAFNWLQLQTNEIEFQMETNNRKAI